VRPVVTTRRRVVRAVPRLAAHDRRPQHHQGARPPRRPARRHPRVGHDRGRRRGRLMASFSDSIIEEFRANGGQVTRPYPDSTLVLVTLRGAKSGREMTLPIEYLLDDGRLVVLGTQSGAPDNPAWVYNLRADPDVTVEFGSERSRRPRARSPARS